MGVYELFMAVARRRRRVYVWCDLLEVVWNGKSEVLGKKIEEMLRVWDTLRFQIGK